MQEAIARLQLEECTHLPAQKVLWKSREARKKAAKASEATTVAVVATEKAVMDAQTILATARQEATKLIAVADRIALILEPLELEAAYHRLAASPEELLTRQLEHRISAMSIPADAVTDLNIASTMLKTPPVIQDTTSSLTLLQATQRAMRGQQEIEQAALKQGHLQLFAEHQGQIQQLVRDQDVQHQLPSSPMGVTGSIVTHDPNLAA